MFDISSSNSSFIDSASILNLKNDSFEFVVKDLMISLFIRFFRGSFEFES